MMKRRKEKRNSGFTLIETMGVVGILAVLLAVAIPSVLSLQQSVKFKRLNEYAKDVFLAAQSNLTTLRTEGRLSVLQPDADGILPDGATQVPGSHNAQFPATDWSMDYYYTTGGEALDLLLPATSIDTAVRDGQMLIEYNPVTGNVYAVFYADGDTTLTYSTIARDETTRRKKMVGYYASTDLYAGSTDGSDGEQGVFASVDGEENILRATVEVPEEYINRPQAFLDGLSVSVTVEGEYTAELRASNEKAAFTIPAETLNATKRLLYGSMVEVEFSLDSLADQKSFASLAQNNKTGSGTRAVSSIASSDSFVILPGDNLTLTAHFTFTNPDDGTSVQLEDVTKSGVNSMFYKLVPVMVNGVRKFNLYINNGRHLQNLNAIAPEIAQQVRAVYFESDIYWNETVDYYNTKYGSGGTYTNATSESPARCLPYFVPISSPALFGKGYFNWVKVDGEGYTHPQLVDLAYGDANEVTSTTAAANTTTFAKIKGNNKKVYYLNIDANKYNIGKDYYAGSAVFANDQFTGLFSYLNTEVSNLYVVNPIIKGVQKDAYVPTTGGLVGTCGFKAFIHGCGVYIDTADQYFSRSSLSGYGVQGYGAVGGLVGYAKSHYTTSGELEGSVGDGEEDTNTTLAFSNCFAAVPVTGTMRGTQAKRYGYAEGTGGLIGVSILTNFYNCYASGNVTAKGYLASSTNSLKYAVGVGGFVGTNHGTRYANCFATGNVTATGTGYTSGSYTNHTVGGFVGAMVYAEGFNYTNAATGSTTRVAQGTTFNSCYAVGTVTANGTTYENFAGVTTGFNALNDANGIGHLTPGDSGTGTRLISPSYYTYCASKKTTPSNSWNYLYKDSYYLSSGKKVSQMQTLTDYVCATAITYAQMQDLTGYQQTLSNGATTQLLKTEYLTGFKGTDWETATESTTHSYQSSKGQVYPFLKLKNLDYYGDWPSPSLDSGLAYYEQYSDGTVGYYLNGDSTSTLSNTLTIQTDGYAVLSKSKGTVTVTVNNTTATLTALASPVTLDGISYYVYRLPYSILAAADTQNFYTQITANIKVTSGTQTQEKTYTMYFNPYFAYTQVNPAVVGTEQQTTATKPDALPSPIAIRTARQFCALGRLPAFWQEGYVYRQELDCSLSAYNDDYYNGANATVKLDKTVYPIGTIDVPFNGVYNGTGGYVQSAALIGFTPSAEAGGSFGLFGAVGAKGVVRGLTLRATESYNVFTTENVKYAGLLVGINSGTVQQVTLQFAKGASLLARPDTTAASYGGLLIGMNNGTVLNCTLTVAQGDVSVDAQSAGALLGASTGSRSSVTTCAVTLGGNFLAAENAQYVGAFAGTFTDGTFTGKIGSVELSVAGTVQGGGTVGGFAGLLGGAVDGLNISLQQGVRSLNGTAAGLAGEARSARIDNAAVVLNKGTICGKTGAGGAFGTATGLRATDVKVTLYGTVLAEQGNAGGFAVKSNTSSMVTLCRAVMETQTVDGEQITGSVQAPNGEAAGFMSVCSGWVENCRVGFAEGAVITGQTAAGFANLQEGTATGCSVSGAPMTGGIVATGALQADDVSQSGAAGFANDIYGIVTQCLVTPVRTDTLTSMQKAYLSAQNSNLLVRSSNAAAAAFANRVNKSAMLTTCAALGTVQGTAGAAGFANESNGLVATSMANTTLSADGAGFVQTNTGTVRDCYAWYDGVQNASIAYGFVGRNEGIITCAYAAPVQTDAQIAFGGSEDGTFGQCYGATLAAPTASGLDGVQHITLEGLANLDARTLNTNGSNWLSAGSSGCYPYSDTLTSYPYPMLKSLPQRGSWQATQVYAYGVAYYEIDENDSIRWQIVELSDPAQTTLGTSLSGNQIEQDEDNTPLKETGYALFYRDASQIESVVYAPGETAVHRTGRLLEAPIGLTAEDGTPLDFAPYTFEVIASLAAVPAENGTTGEHADEYIRVVGVTGGWAVINPAFACSIRTTQDEQVQQVRTAAQLQNMALWPDGNYAITRAIDLTDVTLTPIGTQSAPFTGTVEGNGLAITHYTVSSQGDAGLFGVLQGAKLCNVVLDGASIVIEQAAPDVNAPQYTVGVLAGEIDAEAQLINCQVLGATVTINIETDGETGGNTGKATLVFGALAARSSGTVQDCAVKSLAVTYTPAFADDTAADPTGPVVHVTMGCLLGEQTDGTVAGSTLSNNTITFAAPVDGKDYALQPDSKYSVSESVGSQGQAWNPAAIGAAVALDLDEDEAQSTPTTGGEAQEPVGNDNDEEEVHTPDDISGASADVSSVPAEGDTSQPDAQSADNTLSQSGGVSTASVRTAVRRKLTLL